MLWKRITNAIIEKTLTFAKGAVLKVTNSDNTITTIDLTELAAINGASAADLAKIEGITNGTGAAGKAVVLDANGECTIPGFLTNTGGKLSTEAGTGITGGVGTVYKSSVTKDGGIILSSVYIDLTGLQAIATDGDIIGDAANPAYLGRVTAARNGTVDAIRVTCLEAPAGASADIDLFAADPATGKKDDAVSGLAGQAALVTAGGAWTNGAVKGATAVPGANQYLYLTNGAGANAGTYTGGKFLIEMIGY